MKVAASTLARWTAGKIQVEASRPGLLCCVLELPGLNPSLEVLTDGSCAQVTLHSPLVQCALEGYPTVVAGLIGDSDSVIVRSRGSTVETHTGRRAWLAVLGAEHLSYPLYVETQRGDMLRFVRTIRPLGPIPVGLLVRSRLGPS